jgi:thymidylate kinase
MGNQGFLKNMRKLAMRRSKILSDLFFQLNQKKVRIASWKNNHELDLSLSGETDIDLLLHPSDTHIMFDLLNEYGFVEGQAEVIHYPSVFHYYCYDAQLEKLLHIHLYTKLITGESDTKNYHFPIEAILLERVVIDKRNVPVLHPSDQLLIFLLRHYIKISCVPGLRSYLKDKKSYHAEFNAIAMDVVESEGMHPSKNLVIDSLDFTNLTETYHSNFLLQCLVGLKIRFILNGFCRYNLVENFYQRYAQIGYRLLNKFFFKRKKNFSEEGKFVAITGLDGTGKSSTVEHLYKVFSGSFNCKVIHVGKPKATLLTLPFRGLLQTLKALKTLKSFVNKSNTDTVKTNADITKPTSVVRALMYTVLAYERYKATKLAVKLSNRGSLVIADRFPSENIGVMDSRRIILADNSHYITKLLSNLETRCYEFCGMPDLLLNLKVPVEVSIERNNNRVKEGKETDEDIRERYRINSNLTYKAYSIIEVDMNREKQECMKDICSLVWNSVSGPCVREAASTNCNDAAPQLYGELLLDK